MYRCQLGFVLVVSLKVESTIALYNRELTSQTVILHNPFHSACRYVKGEEGFCLTSFMTALKFVSHMSS